MIGFKYYDMINKGEMTLDQALDDIMAYTRSHNMNPKEVQYCWLSLHLGLGLCFQLKVNDKKPLRRFLLELLQYSRGIDMGLFMRDFMYYDDLSVSNETLDKAYHVIQAAAGFVVDFTENKLGDKLFKGPARVVYKELIQGSQAYYLDIPIGHPTLLMTGNTSSDNHIGTQCLTLACENLKPQVVLLLLQYGATPHGKPLEHVLRNLGSQQIIEEATGQGISENPMELLERCLEYILRTIKTLHLNFDGQTVAHLKEKSPHVYFIRESAARYLPSEYYKAPRKLKQLCRCEIRETLLKNDQLPSGITNLPNLSEHLVKYVQLAC
ncbi:uncharacterized protein LOC134244356 [Saccostrea cucullata]|uniref:uncharacterized protein LOC134244356 n=1 Tax=Saccostrea cuccullata TaxID=36930 RepID=UPI002ED3CBDA